MDKYIKSEETIPFSYDISDYSVELKLDDNYNFSLYNVREKDEFKVTQTAYLLATPGKQQGVDYDVIVGATTSWTKAGTVVKDITDIIVFAKERTKSLKYFPYGQVTAKWNPPNSVGFSIVDGSNVFLSEETIGVLECNYKVLSDRIGIRYNGLIKDEVEVEVSTSYKNGNTGNEKITFIVAAKKDVELLVSDIETGQPIAGAVVSITGSGISGTLSQATDIAGKTTFAALEVGSSYNVIMIHTNYVASNMDYLRNDSFVVS